MANSFAPQGFQPLRRYDGAAWSANQNRYKIAAANTHKFFHGDPVIILSTGYIDGGASYRLALETVNLARRAIAFAEGEGR